MLECLGFVGNASNLVNLVISFGIIKDFQILTLIHSVRSIILYLACIMSFVWRSTVTSTAAPPGISNAGLLVIRIAITVVLVIGLLYGFLIMTTFRRYGVVMDKAWKQRIDRWIEEKNPGNKGLFGQPLFDNPQYPSMPYTYPNGSTMYQQPTYKPSRYYQPSFGDARVGGDAWSTYSPAHVSDAYVPPPDPYSPPTRLPHSQMPTDTVILNQSSNLQNDGYDMASAVYNPTPGTTPPPLPPKVPITSAEETPPRFIRKKPNLAVAPPPSLPPIPGTPIPPFADTLSKNKDNELGSSSSHDELMIIPEKSHLLAVPRLSLLPVPATLMTPFADQSSQDNDNALESSSDSSRRGNKIGGDNDVLDDEDRVRFRSSSISDQGIIDNLASRHMGVEVEVEVSGSSNNGLSHHEGEFPDKEVGEKEEQERQKRRAKDDSFSSITQ